MNKYSVKKGSQGENILYINGIISRCPFTPPIAVPDPIAQTMRITFMPCSTNCPHAAIHQYGETQNPEARLYEISCSGYSAEFGLEDDEPTDSHASKLVSL